jgi:hypothetical protein
MSITPPPGQNRRLKNINNILKYYKENDIPDNMINKIRYTFPEVKYYDYLHTEEIKLFDLIQMVDLDLTKLSIVGKCIKFKYGENNSIQHILLHNSISDTYWKINPTKYYIFKVISDSDIIMKKNIDMVTKIIKKKN